MESEALKTLEFEKITNMLRDRAGSVLGKERADALRPGNELDDVQERMQQTAEAVRIYSTASPPLGGIWDIRTYLKKVRLGAVLEVQEISEIMSTMYAMRNVKRFFKEMEIDAPILRQWAQGLEILGQLERNIENTIDEHGGIRDDASVELARIRHTLRSSQNRIKEQLSSVLHSAAYQKYFQDAIVTMRGDRYVIPIKQEYRQYFPGIVQDQSASGSTLFIEPMAVVELNNDVRQLALSEQHEMERILRALSQQISRSEPELIANCNILADIDFSFAKARLARDMNAVEPQLNDEGRTKLVQARHPLIDADQVVPITISLGDTFRMLLITGPNTGGKTVSMKTLGLHVLMAQAGCFIPAAADSEVSVYQNIYTDIGDEQSIEQSLSTFSAHMTHIVKILQQAGTEDLLLLDELGAGTDPEEGAALAMAVLEQLLGVRASTVATTHYSELKTFAYTREGIENACVEFDIRTLRPTYRLLIGIPGASNAFAISHRLGLAESVILRAQQLIKADHAQFEHVINELENEKMMYEQRNADITERQQRVQQLESKVELMKTELSQKKAKMLRKAKDDSAALVRRTRRETEAIIKELKAQFDDQGIQKRQQAMQDARSRLNAASSRTRPGIISEKSYRKPIDIKTIAIGDIVYVTTLAQKGTVLAIQDKELAVQLGSMKMNIKASACRFVESASRARKASSSGKSSDFLQKAVNIRRELDIRGLMVDEAEQVLDKFLDDAVMAGMSQVLIIHGKGTGVLRKNVHAYLKHHRSVLHFVFADATEGGTGATVVDLK